MKSSFYGLRNHFRNIFSQTSPENMEQLIQWKVSQPMAGAWN